MPVIDPCNGMHDAAPGTWAIGNGQFAMPKGNAELEILWQQRRKLRRKIHKYTAALMRTERAIAEVRGASRTGHWRAA